MTPIEIIKHFMDYADYDPNQRTFRWGTANQQLNSKCKNIATINSYDPSGAFAILYAKQCFTNWLNACNMTVFDAVAHPEKVEEEIALWRVFTDPSVTQVESQILNAFESLLDKVSDKKLIGARDVNNERDALLASIEAVVEALPKCNVNLFLRGGPILPVTNFSTSIHVFERLCDCLLALEQAEDGIYVCYIEGHKGSLDGYFGFYLKSNGTILSVNERIEESYPGEHSGHRNARFIENKQLTLFPYDFIISTTNPKDADPDKKAERDYKGYTKTMFIDDEKLAFLNLEPKAYMPLIVAMLMLNSKYANTTIEDMPTSYVDSLLQVNLDRPKLGTTELMIPTGSAIATVNREFKLNMTSEGIRNGSYASYLSWSAENNASGRRYCEYGTFPVGSNIFVDLYGDGFELDPNDLLEANPHLQKLTDGTDSAAPAAPHPEYVGTEVRMEVLAYYRGRKQLAQYIRQKMFEEYIRFGGADAVEQWYKSAMLDAKGKVIDLCLRRAAFATGYSKDSKHACEGLDIRYYTDCTRPGHHFSDNRYNNYIYNEYIDERNHDKGFRCPVTGNKASIFFVFAMNNWKEISYFTGIDAMPKILKGYEAGGHRGIGNSILNATDEVFEIGTPFEGYESDFNNLYWSDWKWREHISHMSFFHNIEVKKPENLPARGGYLSFDFAIGFSKRGWAKIQKEASAT